MQEFVSQIKAAALQVGKAAEALSDVVSRAAEAIAKGSADVKALDEKLALLKTTEEKLAKRGGELTQVSDALTAAKGTLAAFKAALPG